MLRSFLLVTFSLFCLLASSFPELTSAYAARRYHRRYHRHRRFNISSFIYPRNSVNGPNDDFLYAPSLPPPFFKDVVNAIKKKERWDSEDEVKITQLDLKNSRIGDSRRYEVSVGSGEDELFFKMTDLVSSWKRLPATRKSDFEALVKKRSSIALLDSFEIHGPLHLSVYGDHNLSLSMPVDVSIGGLKQILVGEGITVEVSGASQVSLLLGKNIPDSGDKRLLRYLSPSVCMAQPHLRIFGSATLIAYRTQSPEASIRTRYLSKRTVELLQAKCYGMHAYGKWASSVNLVQSRMPLLEKVIRRFIAQKTYRDSVLDSVSLHAKVIASSMFRFRLELQREIQSNDRKWNTLTDWRTKPGIQRVWFSVVARADGNVLKLVLANKLKPVDEIGLRYYINLKTNISFTKFPALIVPQKSLTLDVNW